MSKQMIDVAKDFSRYPAGRVLSDGPNSGERFKIEFLKKYIELGEALEIHLDGTRGYGSSFLEEAFGGLVRDGLIRSMSEFDEKIVLVSESTALIKEIREYIHDEIDRTTH